MVNNSLKSGKPTSYCYDTLNTFVKAYSRTGYIIGFIMVGITAAAFLCGLWLRCEVNSDEEQRRMGHGKNDGPSQMRLNY